MFIAQIFNGKIRGKATVPADIGKDEMEKLARENDRVRQLMEGKTVRKIIVVPGKLVNIVVG